MNVLYCDDMYFQVNDGRIKERDSVEYREVERVAGEIHAALSEVREGTRQAAAQAAAPKAARTYPFCGAATTPDASGRCKYCGGTLETA